MIPNNPAITADIAPNKNQPAVLIDEAAVSLTVSLTVSFTKLLASSTCSLFILTSLVCL